MSIQYWTLEKNFQCDDVWCDVDRIALIRIFVDRRLDSFTSVACKSVKSNSAWFRDVTFGLYCSFVMDNFGRGYSHEWRFVGSQRPNRLRPIRWIEKCAYESELRTLEKFSERKRRTDRKRSPSNQIVAPLQKRRRILHKNPKKRSPPLKIVAPPFQACGRTIRIPYSIKFSG